MEEREYNRGEKRYGDIDNQWFNMHIKHFLVCVKRKMSLEDTDLIPEISQGGKIKKDRSACPLSN